MTDPPAMTALNPAWVAAMTRAANDCPYFRLQSMVIRDLTAGESRVEIAMAEKHLQPFGIAHGGVFSSLLDAAGWWAAYTAVGQNQGLATLELKLNYLAPAREGLLIGHGRLVKMGRTVGLAEARITDADNHLLTHGTVTVMITDLLVNGHEDLPPKFL